MKLRVIAAALVMAMLLSGCSAVGLDVQTLMHPPKASGEREAIHTLLQKKAGENITLKYPHSGDYRSAIIMQDITGDKQEEAIAFYQSGDEGSGIHMVFINKVDGKWNLIASFHNSSTQVDKVCFGDVNGDGKNEVIVGWENAISNTGELCVYTCSNNKVTELNLKQTYSQMAVGDFNDDGHDEIFTASTTMQDRPAVAKLMHITSDKLEIMGTAHLDTGVTKYAPITVGRINEKQYGVVLDGSKSSSTMVTEVLYWDKNSKTLQSPFYDRSTQSANFMLRNTSTVSQDINNDKIIEIPVTGILPGCQSGTTDETCYSINWKRYDTTTKDLIAVMSTVMNSSGGYWFLIPDMWKGKITVKTDEKTHSMTFYEWKVTPKSSKGSLGVALLKIQVFTDKEWNSGKNANGYFKLLEQNNTVYAANISQPSNTLSMNIDDIKNSFKLISQE